MTQYMFGHCEPGERQTPGRWGPLLRDVLAPAMLLMIGAVNASAGEVQQTFSSPTLDRWNYVFAGFGQFAAGQEPDAPTFSPFGNPQAILFDNRDGEMVVGFDTTSLAQPGLGTGNYRVLEASVTLVVSRDFTFQYDPTPDPVQSYFNASDPEFVADADGGRPIEMHLLGYRSGESVATYTETSAFSPNAPGTLPAKGTKNAFSAQYDPQGSGVLREVSNNVDQRFDNRPLAIGTTTLTPGSLVPAGTQMTFSVNFENNADAQRYFREGLNAGRLNVSISSLSTVGQQSSITPAFWCREGDTLLGAVPASLSLRVCVGRPSDLNCDNAVDLLDLLAFIGAWTPTVGGAGSGIADYRGDGRIDLLDLLEFLSAWQNDLGT